MNKVPFRLEEIIRQCRHHLKVRLELDDDYIVLQHVKGEDTSFAARLAGGFDKYDLKYDLAMMKFMQAHKPSTESMRFTIPIGYEIIQDGDYDYLIMENLEGPTIWNSMKNGTKELSEEHANQIAATLQDLRQCRPPCEELIQSNALTPLCHWYPQGHIFAFDNDGGRLLKDIPDFTAFMATRFQAAKVNLKAIPLTPCVITHGELTPESLKLCPDGTIGFMDLRRIFVGPVWWEYYALHASHYSRMYIDPLKAAMSRYGMSAREEIMSELDDKFLTWFALWGGAWARAEIREQINN